MKLHETQKQQMHSNEVTFENEPIANLQYIEGGGPPKRVNLNEMPKWIGYFGYFFLYIIPLLFVGLIILSFFR
ncbi:hypothetical protein D3C73_1594420 [compost metagenome]